MNKLQKTAVKSLVKTKDAFEKKIENLKLKRNEYLMIVDTEINNLQSVVDSTIATIEKTSGMSIEDTLEALTNTPEILANNAIIEEQLQNQESTVEPTEIETTLSTESVPFTEEDQNRMHSSRSQQDIVGNITNATEIAVLEEEETLPIL